MPWKPRQSAGGDFAPVPVGLHAAVCSVIADIGVQPQTNTSYKPVPKIVISWLLPSTLTEDSKPMTISTTFTDSMNKKANLRKFIETWFGKTFATDEQANDFDYGLLLGRKCMVSVVHKDGREGKLFANVTGAMKPMAGVVIELPSGFRTVYYAPKDPTLAPAQLSQAYGELPEWIRKKIDQRLPEEKPAGVAADVLAEAAADAGADDDIPF
jgi:hypothetical protein